MEVESFKKVFLKNKSDELKLQKVIDTAELKVITETIWSSANEDLGFNVWSSVLSLMKNEEDLFEIVKEVRSLQSLGEIY